MPEKQTPEIGKIESTAKAMMELPEKFRSFNPTLFHQMYKILGSDGNGDPTLKGSDAKKVAAGTAGYLIRQLESYLGIKGGLGKDFLERKADSTGLTFRDLFLSHNGLPITKGLEKILEAIVEEGKIESVLPSLSRLAQDMTKKYLEKQTGFVAGETEHKIMTNEAYQKAAQAFVKSVTGKPTDAVGEDLAHQYSEAAVKKYGKAMHGNN